MQGVVRSYAMAGLALAGAGVIAVTPVVATPSDVRVATPSVQLTDMDLGPLGNFAVNLFYSFINIPANELNAMQHFADAQFYSGPWAVVSPINLWGTDLGDPPRIEALTDMALPFPALSGPLGEQIAGFMQAEFPTNVNCHDVLCPGVFDLLGSWGKVPLSDLADGYTFPSTGPTVIDPLGPLQGAYGFPGTIEGPDGEALMPWAGSTFTLDLAKPFTDFFNSLFAPVPDDPLVPFPDVFKVLSDFVTSFFVMFNPFLPGGTYFPEVSAASADLMAGLDGLFDGSIDFTTALNGVWTDLGDLWAALVP